jgi:hypothetical protein
MRKIAVILAVAFFGFTTMASAVAVDDREDKKTKVQQHELPQEVIQSLEESEYQNWEIQEAYKVEDELTQEVNYELHLASDYDAEMVKSVTFNEDGEIIREEESDFGRTDDQLDQQQPGFEDHGIEEPRDEPGMQPGTQPETGQPGTERPGEQY